MRLAFLLFLLFGVKTVRAFTMSNNDLKPYMDMLQKIRSEPFNEETERKLMNHPYIAAAKSGDLTLAQRQAFCLEQFAIQKSDASSFKALSRKIEDEGSSEESEKKLPDLFQFLYEGELYASNLLNDHAKSVGVKKESDAPQSIAESNGYKLTAKGQTYPSFWARLALNDERGGGAAACAVNFPAWGSMCKELLEALKSNKAYGYSEDPAASKEALAFIDFFANPIEDLDIMAATIMKQEEVKYEDIIDTVRLLQEYEIFFWDACFDAK